MKVLHIIDSLGLGGAQTIVKGIFEAQKSNKDIFLFALRKRDITIKINHPNMIIYPSSLKYSFKPIRALCELIKKEKPEVLHCHLFRSQVFGWILKKFYFPNIRLIFHEHGQIFQTYYYALIMNLLKHNVDLFIAVSKATKDKLIKRSHISKDKIKVLYNFVDLNKFNRDKIKINVQKERQKLGIRKDEFVIGFVGRLSKVKGCEYLIRALPLLNFNYKCVIVGDGPLRKKLEKLSKKLRVQDKVIFLGYKEDTPKIYPLFDLLVVPSINESFGLSVIEAQALRIPVIASNIPALNEVIKNNMVGLLFRTESSNDLTSKIIYLNNNPKLRATQAEEGKRNVKKYYIKNYLQDLKDIYVSINYRGVVN